MEKMLWYGANSSETRPAPAHPMPARARKTKRRLDGTLEYMRYAETSRSAPSPTIDAEKIAEAGWWYTQFPGQYVTGSFTHVAPRSLIQFDPPL